MHEGLAALFAYRIAQLGPISFTLAANDYGLELLSGDPAPIEEAIEAGLFSTGASAPRYSGQPQRGRAGAAAVPRDRAGRGAHLPGISRREQVGEAGAGLERIAVRRLRPVRPGQPAAVPGPSRGAGAPARAEPSGHARWTGSGPGACRWSTWSGRRRSRSRCSSTAHASRSRSEKLADRIRRMAAPLREGRRRPAIRARAAPGLSERRMTDVQVRLAGEDVLLLPERALFWPRAATLVAADFHWGKGADLPRGRNPDSGRGHRRRPDPARRRAAPNLRAAPGHSRRSVSCARRPDRRPDVRGAAPLAGAAPGARDPARSGQPRPPCRRSARRSPNQQLERAGVRAAVHSAARAIGLGRRVHPRRPPAPRASCSPGPGWCASTSPASG